MKKGGAALKTRWLFYATECLTHFVLSVAVCAAIFYLTPYFSAARVVRLAVLTLCVLCAVGGRVYGFFRIKNAKKRVLSAPFSKTESACAPALQTNCFLCSEQQSSYDPPNRQENPPSLQGNSPNRQENPPSRRGNPSNRRENPSANCAGKNVDFIARLREKPFRLYAACALYFAAVAFVGKYLSAGISILLTYFLSGGILFWGAVCLTAVLFGIPCFLMGESSPALGFSAEEKNVSVAAFPFFGGVGILLGATLGVTAFSALNPTGVLVFAAFLLLVLYCVRFLLTGEHLLRQSIAFVLCYLCAAGSASIPFCFIDDTYLTAERFSRYGYYKVERMPSQNTTTLSSFAIEGANLTKNDKKEISNSYATRALAAFFMAEDGPSDVLCMGLGTGAFATEASLVFEPDSLTVCERDGALISLAETYFGVSENLSVKKTDGRSYLSKTSRSYRVIFIDEYRSFTLPDQTAGVEFFRLVKSRLESGGVLALHLTAWNSDFSQGVLAAIASVFPSVCVAVEGEEGQVFASDLPDLALRFQQKLFAPSPEFERVSDAMNDVFTFLTPYAPTALPLTDKSARSFALEWERMEEMVSPAYAAYRKKLKKDGVWELFS